MTTSEKETVPADLDVVTALHDALVERVGIDRFRLWFGANTRLVFGNGMLVVEAATPFFQDWLRANFRDALQQAAFAVTGQAVEVGFRVNPELGKKATEADSENGERADHPGVPAPDAKKSGVEQRVTDQESTASRSELPRRSAANFDSFVVGHANRVANASAIMVAEDPGCLTPLYLYGTTSVGKTHLLESIWTAVLASRPRCRALSLDAEQFTSLFLEALHHSGLPNFRRKYRNVELLILDDVQFFVGKKATLTELLYTVES
ncbi:MAG: DnaA/Hda family protein, partial [Planctomycetales bacterium]